MSIIKITRIQWSFCVKFILCCVVITHVILKAMTSFTGHHSPLYCTTSTPSYSTRGIRFFCRCLFLQQRLLCQHIFMLESDFLVSFTIDTNPTRPQILSTGELIEHCWIFQGVFHSIVSSTRNHIYDGGLTLLSSPHSQIKEVTSAVADARID